jgi:fumarate hydratase class II
MSEYRVTYDSMGEMRVPANAGYGAQTARAIENFAISGLRFPRPFIRALELIKKAAAHVNGRPGPTTGGTGRGDRNRRPESDRGHV